MTNPSGMNIDVYTEDTRTVVAPEGEIDYGNVGELRAVLLEVSQGEAVDVVVDLGGVTFIDSTALSVLVQAKQRLEELDRRMAVRDAQPRVERVLELAGLNSYLFDG